MPLLEGKTPAERKKTIAAIVLGAVAVIVLGYMFLGSSSKTTSQGGRPPTKPTPNNVNPLTANNPGDVPGFIPTPIVWEPVNPVMPPAGRNIFAFYVPPPPKPTPIPTPKPTPPPIPPNVVLSSISPANVFAHTGDFTLDVTGDKFTPETRVLIGGAEIPTRFISAQQLSARVPAQIISFEGGREIVIRSRDGVLFSNTATLNVMAAPQPAYTLIGITLKNGANDTAIMKEKNGKELLTVQRGDIIGQRFRVTSISKKEVVVTDIHLKLKYPLQLVGDNSNPASGQPPYRPPVPPPADEDPEP